jgi:hypothetical protein
MDEYKFYQGFLKELIIENTNTESMRKIYLLLMSLIFLVNIKAQVIVNLQLPQVGLNLKSQLWNMTLTNVSTTAINIKINMVLADIATGQQVLSGATGMISVSPGTKIIQYNDVVPVNYTVLNSNYNVDATPNGFLPIGNFSVCYEILKLSNEIFETMAEDCANIEVEPVSPPFLVLPGDMAEIDDRRPLFVWLPPAPVTQFSNLSYTLQLVEVLPNQNSQDAIDQNFPVLSQTAITGLSFQYPAVNPMLDTGKTYAWQITANNNSLFIAKSEIWTFKETVFGTDNAVYSRNRLYFKLLKTPSLAYYICDGMLKFEYQNELNDNAATIRIYDVTNQNKVLINLNSNTVSLKNGQNLIDIDLRDISNINTQHIYTIELINSKQEAWAGKFEYKPNNN